MMGYTTNLHGVTVSATGIILPESPPITPQRPYKGFGGRLCSIHGDATAGGTLDFHDGVDAAGLLVFSLPMPIGWVNFEPCGSYRFINGVFVVFTGVAGSFLVSFA